MAPANQKITLSSSRDIPFNKLTLSQSNVRRVKAGVSIEELAESIARRSLIQSLHVRSVLDDDGKETGMYEVPAGGRRFRALELLVKQKRLNKTAPVPCVVSEASGDILIDEISLAENIERAPLHPLDQFRAFLSLHEKGLSDEEIGAAFFVTAQVVKQRLRLTSVAPSLLEIYSEDGMRATAMVGPLLPLVDPGEAMHAPFGQLPDRGRDSGRLQPVESGLEPVVIPSADAPADEGQDLVRSERYDAFVTALGRRLAKGPKLRQEISEDVLAAGEDA